MPPSPTLSGFLIEPRRRAARTAAEEPKKSSGQSGSKRAASTIAGHDGASLSLRKKKKKTLSEAVADNAAALTPTLTASKGDEKSKRGSGVVQRLWSEDDEIAILRGIHEYRAKTGSEWNSDSNAFFAFIKGSFHVQVSRNQLMDKIRKLKKKFLVAEKSKKGEGRSLSRPHDLEAFELSKKIWGNREAGEETQTVNKGNTNGYLECVVGGVESKSIPEAVDNRTGEIVEKRGAGKRMDGIDVDEFCARHPYLVYAVETTVSQKMLGELPDGLLLERVKAFGGNEAREWDDKLKALQFEEVHLHSRKLSFIAEISEETLVALMK